MFVSLLLFALRRPTLRMQAPMSRRDRSRAASLLHHKQFAGPSHAFSLRIATTLPPSAAAMVLAMVSSPPPSPGRAPENEHSVCSLCVSVTEQPAYYHQAVAAGRGDKANE